MSKTKHIIKNKVEIPDISSKLDKGDYEGTASELLVEAEDKAKELDNEIQIGGRNYFNTQKIVAAPQNLSSPVVDGNDLVAISQRDEWWLTLSIDGFTTKNKYYTVSGILEIDGNPVTYDDFYYKRISTLAHSSDVLKFTVDSTGYFVSVQKFDKDISWVLHTRIKNSIAGSIVKISNLQIEEGTKATSYKPALEDRVADWNETNPEAYDFIKSKPTKLTDFANDANYITIEDVHAHPNKSVLDNITQEDKDRWDNDFIAKTEIGAVNGVASLDDVGKVPASQLPDSYATIEEYATFNDFPPVGVTGTTYIAQDTDLSYLWSGSQYVQIGSNLALGETQETAYRGDRGKIAYDHSQTEHQTIINGNGYVVANGKNITYDNTQYQPAGDYATNSALIQTENEINQRIDAIPIMNDTFRSDEEIQQIISAENKYLNKTTGGEVSGNIGLKDNQLYWDDNYFDDQAVPRTFSRPQSIQLFNNHKYSMIDGRGRDMLRYGTVLNIYGKVDHTETQLYYTGDNEMYIRTAFYGDTDYSDWTRFWTSKNFNPDEKADMADIPTKLSMLENDLVVSTTQIEGLQEYVQNNSTNLSDTDVKNIIETENYATIPYVNNADATVLQQAEDKAKELDNAIEVGGRNLVLNSKELFIPVATSGTASDNSNYKILELSRTLNAGKHIFNCDIEIHKGDFDKVTFLFRDINHVSKRYTSEYIVDGTITFEYEAVGVEHYLCIYAGKSSQTAGNSLSAKNIKLEEGNKKTSYTIAPEDEVADWAQTDPEALNFVKNKPDLSTKLDKGTFQGTATDLKEEIDKKGTVKTVNNIGPDENGNIQLEKNHLSLSMSNNAQEMSISTTPSALTGNFNMNFNRGNKLELSDNTQVKVVCKDTKTKLYTFLTTFNIKATGIANRIKFQLYKNNQPVGVPIERYLSSGGDIGAASIIDDVELSENDVLELKVSTERGNSSCNIKNISVILKEV